MKAVVLAGGFGTRVAAVAGGSPKPLLEVAGRPILEHQITTLHDLGVGDIRLSLHHKARDIIDFCTARWPGALEFFVEDTPLGTGGAVQFATRDCADVEELLVVNCDNLVRDMDLARFAAGGANAIGCVFMEDARQYGLVQIEDGHAVGFREKPEEKTSGFINAGWYILKPAALRSVGKDAFMLEHDLFPVLAAARKLKAYHHRGYWIDAGTEDRLKQADKDLAMLTAGHHHS